MSCDWAWAMAPLFFLGRETEKQQRNSKAQAEQGRAKSRLENGTFPDGNLPHAQIRRGNVWPCLLPLRDGNGDSWTTRRRRPRLVPRGWVRMAAWGSEVTGQLLPFRSHRRLCWYRLVQAGKAATPTGSSQNPHLLSPPKKQGQIEREALRIVVVVVLAAQVAVLAGLVGRVRSYVLCPSMWSSHPTFTLSHPAEDRFPGSPLTKPGWHFSRRGIASCKVASLFQGFFFYSALLSHLKPRHLITRTIGFPCCCSHRALGRHAMPCC